MGLPGATRGSGIGGYQEIGREGETGRGEETRKREKHIRH